MGMDWDTANSKHIGPTINKMEDYLGNRWARFVHRQHPGVRTSAKWVMEDQPRVYFAADVGGYMGVHFKRSLHLPEYPHGLPDSEKPEAHIRFYNKMFERVKARKWETEWRKEMPSVSVRSE